MPVQHPGHRGRMTMSSRPAEAVTGSCLKIATPTKKNTTIVRDFQIPFSISDKLSRQNQQKNSGLHTLTKWTQNRIHRALSSTSCARPRQVEQLKKTNTMQMPFIYLFFFTSQHCDSRNHGQEELWRLTNTGQLGNMCRNNQWINE